MRALIKTKEEMLDTPGVYMDNDTNKLRRKGSRTASPHRKLEEICGTVIFCYNHPHADDIWASEPYSECWTIESWMIKEILVE